MDVSLLKTQWDAFSSNPVPAIIFIAVAASASWWLKSAIDKGQIEALKEKHAVLEERARLAADKVQPVIENALETDEKGNVKPPSTPTDSEKPESDGDSDQFTWLIRMEYAYRSSSDDCLTTTEQYYDKLKASPAALPLPLIEAEYLLARFRCGNRSSLSDLKTLSGRRTDAYYANVVLGRYYESVGELETALRCLEDRYAHSPNMECKLYSALALADLFSKREQFEKCRSFLIDQLTVFQSADAHASIWEKLGGIYDLQKMEWRKQICFEKSLTHNPDNTELRFSLAYSYGDSSYGQAMAAHHYQILRIQSPRNSTVFNNLSVIYDEVGAVPTKIDLLREAQHRKDAYVGANLARAYAKAGFLADAREALKDVPANGQQEDIVQAAYHAIKEESKADDDVTEKLERSIRKLRDLIEKNALTQVNETDDDLLQKFVGEWQLEEGSVLKLWTEHRELLSAIVVVNRYYEYATYKITTRYQPGLLEMNATLDETSLKPRAEPNAVTGIGAGFLGGFGNTTVNALSLLSGMGTRPYARVMLLLMPGEDASLHGLKTTSEAEKHARAMLNAQEVHLIRRDA